MTERLATYHAILSTPHDGLRRASQKTQDVHHDRAMVFLQRCQAIYLESRMLRRGALELDSAHNRAGATSAPDGSANGIR